MAHHPRTPFLTGGMLKPGYKLNWKPCRASSEGDTVFCHSMDRLAATLRRIVLGLTERSVHIVFVT